MNKIILVFAVVGCANHANEPDPDATDANDSDGHSNGDGALNGDGSSYTCTVLPNANCCVFDTSSSACTGTNVCQYDSVIDNSWHTSPSQGAGTCRPPGTLAIGASCSVNSPLPPTCGQGAWCAYDANSATTGTGTCRKLCDPLDQAAHGCSTGTCVGMLYCDGSMQWPNCPSATNTHLGFCQ